MYQNIDSDCEMNWTQLDSAFGALNLPHGGKHSKSMRKSNLFVFHRRRRERISVISACVSFNSIGMWSDAPYHHTRHTVHHETLEINFY